MKMPACRTSRDSKAPYSNRPSLKLHAHSLLRQGEPGTSQYIFGDILRENCVVYHYMSRNVMTNHEMTPSESVRKYLYIS